tara:strand:+ start:1080 stop:1304 length:225 start_codon:yes stop_codon:yes gene_type:complete
MGPIFESRKLKLSGLLAVFFLVLSSPLVYRLVGSLTGLTYDGDDENNRYSLLVIHSVVFLVVAIIFINVYDPVF